MRTAIVLTAAVFPVVTDHLLVRDPELRASQYREAIKSWSDLAANLNASLHVVETTGATRNCYWPEAAPGCHHSFQPDARRIRRGKGALEADALDWVFGNLGGDEFVYKCTGRLFVKNFMSSTSGTTQSAMVLRRRLDWSWVDTRFFGLPIHCWSRSFGKMADEVDDYGSVSTLEHVFARRLHIAVGKQEIVPQRFQRRPILVGSSGSTGRDYNSVEFRIRATMLRPVEAVLAHWGANRTI